MYYVNDLHSWNLKRWFSQQNKLTKFDRFKPCKLKGDDTNYNIQFSKLSCDYKNNIIFKIIMKNCDLYSIYLHP